MAIEASRATADAMAKVATLPLSGSGGVVDAFVVVVGGGGAGVLATWSHSYSQSQSLLHSSSSQMQRSTWVEGGV